MADNPIRTTLGSVSAYLDAKAHGFIGTREQFGEYLANAGNYAQSAHDDSITAETAKTDAVNAMERAETAQGKAEDAQTASENAQEAAENAQIASENAQEAAENAQIASENAQEAAELAQGKAEDAQAAAEAAQAVVEGLEWAGLGLTVVDGELCSVYGESDGE